MPDTHSEPWKLLPSRAFFTLALTVMVHGACSGARPQPVTPPPPPPPTPRVVEVRDPFQVSVVATGAVPIQVGAEVGFRLSSNTGGYANLYLVDPQGAVFVLLENYSLGAGTIDYPLPGAAFTIRASEPIGTNRVIFLVTRDPFDGFSGNNTLTEPRQLAMRATQFQSSLRSATAGLARASWNIDEYTVRVVG